MHVQLERQHQNQRRVPERKKGVSASSTTPPTPIATPTPTTTFVAAPRLSVAAAKGKQPARATSPTDPLDVERTEAEQLKIVLRRSRQETHISQQRGSGTDEGTGSKPGVPDVPSDDSEEELSWNSFDDEDVDEQTKGRDASEGEKTNESDDDNDDQEEAEKGNDDDVDEVTESDKGEDDATESDRESEDEETRGRGLQVSQETEDSHVILTPTQSDAQQESSSTSSFMTNLLNPLIDPASQPPTPPIQIPSLDLQSLPTFASVFRFEDRVKLLEVNFSNLPGRSTTGTQSQQLSASESAFAEEPVQTTCQMEEPLHPVFETVQKINPLFKHLSILNGYPSQVNHQHRIVIGTNLCQLLKETLNHG
nr:hypothetical protein [Tanacetum cinerariifolium]